MNFSEIGLSELVVNPDNDRHGPKGSENEAIAWLFNEHGDKMLSLFHDIVAQNRIFDAPLVKPMNGKFVVFDGNRRVTGLKVLAGLTQPPEQFATEIAVLRSAIDWNTSGRIACQVENDQNVIDQIVSRRHNGTDGGRGQLRWDTRAKANHASRVGGTNQYPVAEAVENFLNDHGYPHAREIARSTLFRLISAKKRQRQFGIELQKDGSLKLLKDESEVLAAFSRVADDILEKELTLRNVLNSEGVDEYMGRLVREELISQEEDRQKTAVNPKRTGNDRKGKKQTSRDTLIPKIDFGIEWSSGQAKIQKVWQELQYVLKFSRNEITIPIVFRVLIELLTEHALNKSDDPRKPSKLAAKTKKVAQEFKSQGLFDAKELSDLERLLGDTKSTRELEVLNRALHSKTALPAQVDLIAIWTSFEKYLLLCAKTR